MRQRSSLLKAVITVFPSVSLPVLAVPLRSHRTLAISDAVCQTDGEFMDAREINRMEADNKRATLFKAWGAAELEQRLRESGVYSEAELLAIIAFPFEQEGEYRWMLEQAREQERRMRASGLHSEREIQQAVADRDPDIQRALKAHTERTAAMQIQRGIRGKLARKRADGERARIAALPPPEAKVAAATVIQARARGWVTRAALERGKTGEMACQTDEVVIFEPTEDVEGEVPLHDPETLRGKRHLEKRLRESGTHSEVDIIRLIYGPEAIDVEHDVIVPGPAGGVGAAGDGVGGGVIDDSMMEIIEPELLEAAPMQPGMSGLQALLAKAGLLDVAIAEYLDLWAEMGVDDGMLAVWQGGVITSAALETDFGIAAVGDRYKILGALKALPSGGVVPGSAAAPSSGGGGGGGGDVAATAAAAAAAAASAAAADVADP
eukprot:SAG22_NODE_155_length_17123_cov_37.528489_1_plen_435_part_10